MAVLNIQDQQVDSLSSNNQTLRIKDFLWSEDEWPEVPHDNYAKDTDIPTISLEGVMERETAQESYDHACKKMVDASEKCGFFKLIDHGVDEEIVGNLTLRLNQLFDLPMERKVQGGRSESLPLGYSASNPNYGQNLPWAEILQLLQSPRQVLEFATKVFDEQHLEFYDAVIRYMEELDKLGMKVLTMLAHGLHLPGDFFTKNFDEKESTMFRANRYPPCPLPDKCLGLGSHSDPHTLTVLLQDDVGGLQVLNSHNEWIGVRPVPNSFIINIGDTLEAWTNGRLKSVVHRAVVNKEKQRLSVAYFLSPKGSGIIDCPPELIDLQKEAKKYVPFSWEDFRKALLIQKRVKGKTALNRYLIP
ncbi:hypothetical protein QQ045_020441 [Rhodiola kirilowii]